LFGSRLCRPGKREMGPGAPRIGLGNWGRAILYLVRYRARAVAFRTGGPRTGSIARYAIASSRVSRTGNVRLLPREGGK